MQDRRISKHLAYVLRHETEYDIKLAPGGWTTIEAVLSTLPCASRAEVERVAATSPRFEVEGDRIRALYGHSVDVDLQQTPSTPPVVLYHGTSPENVASILEHGLKPMQRARVHLAVDREEAHRVGIRHHPRPVILVIDAAAANEEDCLFYQGSSRIWTSTTIPPQFISKS